MKTLYLECNMGAAGDMLMAALLELYPDKEGFLKTMNELGLPGVSVTYNKSEKCGILGTHMHVHVHGQEEGNPLHCHVHQHEQKHVHQHEETHEHNGHHSHTSYHDILHLIDHLNLPDKVKSDIAAVYRIIGDAESRVHGKTLDQIHFHEVGTLDALADVTGCCLLFYLLGADTILSSPIHVGKGTVHCAHGVLPVPAPATTLILTGVPIYSNDILGELCTPTGAAILKHFVTSYEAMPTMSIEKVGYGMGTKDFKVANCIRAIYGTSFEKIESNDQVLELCCNLDDMTPESVSFATEKLLKEGALDVFTTSIGMKKNRPAILLTCLCRHEDKERLSLCLLKHTTTIGIRSKICDRFILQSHFKTVSTCYGDIKIKISEGYGIIKHKPECEDVINAAKKFNVTFEEVQREALHVVSNL